MTDIKKNIIIISIFINPIVTLTIVCLAMFIFLIGYISYLLHLYIKPKYNLAKEKLNK